MIPKPSSPMISNRKIPTSRSLDYWILFNLLIIFCVARIDFSWAFIVRPNYVRPAIASFGTENASQINNKRFKMSNSEPPLTAFLDKLSKTGMDNSRIQKDSLVIAKYDVPDLGKKRASCLSNSNPASMSSSI